MTEDSDSPETPKPPNKDKSPQSGGGNQTQIRNHHKHPQTPEKGKATEKKSTNVLNQLACPLLQWPGLPFVRKIGCLHQIAPGSSAQPLTEAFTRSHLVPRLKSTTRFWQKLVESLYQWACSRVQVACQTPCDQFRSNPFQIDDMSNHELRFE